MIDPTHPYSLEAFKSTFGMAIKDIIPVTISFDPNKYMSSGSPGVTLKSSLLDARRNQLIRVSFPFPTKKGIAPKTFIDINHKNVYPLPPKNLINNHKIKVVDEFKKSRLYDIGEYVTTNAALTFTFPNLKTAYMFWENIPHLCHMYKYTAFFYHLGGGKRRKSPKEEFIPFVSFIDLPYCVPIFNHRKINGMGVCCGFMYKKEHNNNGKITYTTTTVDTLYFILSNHKTNVFYIDGVKLNTPEKIGKDILNYMQHFIETEMAYKKQPDKIEEEIQKNDSLPPLPPQKLFTNIEVGDKAINYADIPISYTTYSTSSTSTWR